MNQIGRWKNWTMTKPQNLKQVIVPKPTRNQNQPRSVQFYCSRWFGSIDMLAKQNTVCQLRHAQNWIEPAGEHSYPHLILIKLTVLFHRHYGVVVKKYIIEICLSCLQKITPAWSWIMSYVLGYFPKRAQFLS